MESLGWSIIISTAVKPYPLLSRTKNARCSCSMKVASSFSYQKFIQYALDKTKLSISDMIPSSLQENFSTLKAVDGKTELKMCSFEAPNIRLLRSLSIETSDGMQVLDFAVFPKAEFDLPIFCANFFTSANTNIVVLDLNPLHDVITDTHYKEKYYKNLIPLGLKYAELLPWGGKLTSESLKFFSPIVIWTKFSSSHENHDILFSAFKDYYKAWLSLMDHATEETDSSQKSLNLEAQHRYLTWRAQKIGTILDYVCYKGIDDISRAIFDDEDEKDIHVFCTDERSRDPGFHVLKRLIGESLAKDVVKKFLFNGVNELGNKTFLDYFPEYKSEDGSIIEKRSIIGKSFEKRPWDTRGVYIGDTF